MKKRKSTLLISDKVHCEEKLFEEKLLDTLRKKGLQLFYRCLNVFKRYNGLSYIYREIATNPNNSTPSTNHDRNQHRQSFDVNPAVLVILSFVFVITLGLFFNGHAVTGDGNPLSPHAS